MNQSEFLSDEEMNDGIEKGYFERDERGRCRMTRKGIQFLTDSIVENCHKLEPVFNRDRDAAYTFGAFVEGTDMGPNQVIGALAFSIDFGVVRFSKVESWPAPVFHLGNAKEDIKVVSGRSERQDLQRYTNEVEEIFDLSTILKEGIKGARGRQALVRLAGTGKKAQSMGEKG